MTTLPRSLLFLVALAPAAASADPLPLRAALAPLRTARSVGRAALGAAQRGDVLALAGHLNPLNVALVGYQKLTAPHATPDAPGSWAPSFHAGRVAQRGMVTDDGRLYMKTTVKVARPSGEIAAPAADAFRGDWTRWGFGGGYHALSPEEYTRRTGHAVAPGAVTYELDPPAVWNRAPGGLIRVNEQLRTRVTDASMHGTLTLSGHVEGPAHVALEPAQAGAVLSGGFDGVHIGGMAKLLGPATMGVMHGAVEAQGFAHLGQHLERAR